MSARVQGRKEGALEQERGVRRENFANGRIIKGDSDHVSGTVHTVTSRAPFLNGRRRWVPRLAGEEQRWHGTPALRPTRRRRPPPPGPGNGFHDSPFPW